ncbi:PAS domain S-box protein, partial [Flagellimonas halotolerans]
MNDYNNLFYHNPLPNWVYELENLEILDVNQAAIDLYGYGRNEFLSLSLKDLVSQGETLDIEAFHENIDHKNGNIPLATFTHKKKNGEEFRVEVHSQKVDFKNKSCVMAVGVDITKKEKQHSAWQQAERRLEVSSNIAKLGYWEFDIRTNTLSWTDKVYEIWGRDKNRFQVTFDGFYNSIHPEDRKLFELEQKNALSGHSEMDFVHRILLPDDCVKWVREQGRLNRNANGDPISFEGTVQDITAQIEEEQRLKLLESVITHTTDAVMITEAEPIDEPGPRILYVNQSFTRMTGYAPEEVIGKSPRILQGPESNKEELAKLGKALRNWEPCEITTINYKKGGTPFWVNFSVVPVADEAGWYTHWIAIERDVTATVNKRVHKDFLSKISTTFKDNEDLGSSLEQVCRLVTHHGDFTFCEVWLPSSHKNSL